MAGGVASDLPFVPLKDDNDTCYIDNGDSHSLAINRENWSRQATKWRPIAMQVGAYMNESTIELHERMI